MHFLHALISNQPAYCILYIQSAVYTWTMWIIKISEQIPG